MRLARVAFGLVCAVGALLAQDTPPASSTPASPAAREISHRLGLVATRAIAYFRSADSIEANLSERGMTLHPDLAVLRLRPEAALDETDAAIGRDDLAAAGKALDRAQALLDRFAAKLGG